MITYNEEDNKRNSKSIGQSEIIIDRSSRQSQYDNDLTKDFLLYLVLYQNTHRTSQKMII